MIKKVISFLVLSLCLLVSVSLQAQPHFGDTATEIALPSVNGDTITLSSLRGKVVLVDFWASWCGPCRWTNKKIAKVYDAYKEKGFEIFGVSVDENKKAWLKAIRKDKISWIQVNDNSGRESKIAADWSVYAIPTSYLIGRDGKLIAMDLSSKELEKTLKKILE